MPDRPNLPRFMKWKDDGTIEIRTNITTHEVLDRGVDLETGQEWELYAATLFVDDADSPFPLVFGAHIKFAVGDGPLVKRMLELRLPDSENEPAPADH